MALESLTTPDESPAVGWWQPDGGERIVRQMSWQRKGEGAGNYYFRGRDPEGVIFMVVFVEQYPDGKFLMRHYCFPGMRYEMLGETDGEGNFWGRWTEGDSTGDWHIRIEGGTTKTVVQPAVVKVVDIADELDDIQELGKSPI